MKKAINDFWEAYLLYMRNREEMTIKFKIEGLGWLAFGIVVAAAILKGLIQ